MDSEGRGELVPTEDVVNSLLEYFVDPILPLKACTKDPPISDQQSMAKQMQAVVLLYNYYCRKQHRLLQHLEFESFCKLAVTLKPALISHMKFMQQGANARSDEFESQFSITEKAIRDACSTCLALDASRDIPGTEGLLVSKVAVLLVDAKEENCHLLFSSLTNGAWSVIERSVETCSLDLKSPCRQKAENKRRRMEIEKTEELTYRMAACTAVQETTGIDQSDLVVLEGHVVNSISDANKAAFFYIMQCNSQSNEGFQVPINDAIESLQGPLLKRISGSWTLTPKVEYYNVLPYARIITDWLIRKVSSRSSPKSNLQSNQGTENKFGKEIAESEKIISNSSVNFSAELGNANVKSSWSPEIWCDGELHKIEDINMDNALHCSPRPTDSSDQCTENKLEKAIIESEKAFSSSLTYFSAPLGNANGTPTPETLFSEEVHQTEDKKGTCDSSSCRGEDTIGAVDCEKTEEEMEDKLSDITYLKSKGSSTVDPEMSKKTPANELNMGTNSSSKRQKVDKEDSGVTCPFNAFKSKTSNVPINVYCHQRKKSSSESNACASAGSIRMKVDTAQCMMSHSNQCQTGKLDVDGKKNLSLSTPDEIPLTLSEVVPSVPDARCVENMRDTLSRTGNAITQTALRVLFRKRADLCCQLRNIEDEIASCDRDINKIMEGGSRRFKGGATVQT